MWICIQFRMEEQKILCIHLSEQGVNSLYGSAEVSWKHTLYLNGTVRNDWFSTLSPKTAASCIHLFPAAYVFSETLNELSWLTFGKLRLGYAEVGSDGDVAPYADQLFYAINGNL